MYFLYEIKFPDGYFYIGITKNLKLRFSQHKRSKYPVGIKIRESDLLEDELYSVIFSSNDQSDILELEEFLVDDELLKNKKCLNLTRGGAKGGYFTNKTHTKGSKEKTSNKLKGRVFSEEHKSKIGITTKKRMLGYVWPEDAKLKLSESSKRLWQDPLYRQVQLEKMKNKKHSEETKNKISLAHQKGGKHHNAKVILCYDINNNFIGEFESIKIASDYFGIPDYSISKVLRGVNKQSSGFIFKYKKLTGTD
jgi:group I intron endonuclease